MGIINKERRKHMHPAQWITKNAPTIITPYNPKNVNPASYDVTLGPKIIIYQKQMLNTTENAETYMIKEKTIELPYVLSPHEFILASTAEYIKVPTDICIELRLKSTIGRMGISHCLSVLFDPGFEGEGTLELYNVSPRSIELIPDMKIGQLLFIPLIDEIAMPHTRSIELHKINTNLNYKDTGRYQGQTGPTPPNTNGVYNKE